MIKTPLPLSPFEARLSVVPRWCIVQTIQKQSVAEHSFNVALIAPRVAEHWGVHLKRDLYDIQRCALLHDATEAFTGDIPTPAKRLGLDKNLLETQFKEYENEELFHYTDTAWVGLAKDIVKAADLLEAGYFLARDINLGNKSLWCIFEDVRDNFYSHMDRVGKKEAGGSLWWHVQSVLESQQDPLKQEAK